MKTSNLFILFKSRCPNVANLIDKDVNWPRQQQRYEKYSARLKKLKPKTKPTNFIDLLEDINKNKAFKSFVSYIESEAKYLINTLDSKQIPALRKIFIGNIFNFDIPNYLNSLGEIQVLSLLTRNDNFELIKIEAELEASYKLKKADFMFLDISDNIKKHVEVKNIHLNDEDYENLEVLKIKIESKLQAHIDEKIQYIEKNVSGEVLTFAPIIWILKIDKILPIYSFFKEKETDIHRKTHKGFNYFVFGYLSMLQNVYEDSLDGYKFGYVTTLLDFYKNYHKID